jgi:hypothetical protein
LENVTYSKYSILALHNIWRYYQSRKMWPTFIKVIKKFTNIYELRNRTVTTAAMYNEKTIQSMVLFCCECIREICSDRPSHGGELIDCIQTLISIDDHLFNVKITSIMREFFFFFSLEVKTMLTHIFLFFLSKQQYLLFPLLLFQRNIFPLI